MRIDHVHLAKLDLNLLVALDALLSERSVTRAALVIGISQSAMSHALSRLRTTFADELLTRVPAGMRPTPRALGRRQSRHVCVLDRIAFRPQLVQARLDIDRVPQHDHIEHQAECT